MAKVSYCSKKALICNAAERLKAALFITFSQVPLRDSTVDIAVFCLSLMGTNLGDFLAEANRVLGWIPQYHRVDNHSRDMDKLFFFLLNKYIDTENSHFYSFEFIKTGKAPGNVKKVALQLKPCLYKKR
uniref:Ribosomal RNA-processing protein 8 n=1 Tax=Sinocyclocheilus grahami TaxID=75366 RepID=A0A672LXL5_SINGR